MQEVFLANPFKPNNMGSFGQAREMIIRQFQFPNTYEDDEKMESAYSDRCFQWDYDHAEQCVKTHTGTGEGILESWFSKSTDAQILSFIIDMLKSNKNVVWTGYRILGSVSVSSGYATWYMELFAKNPNSQTKVYSTLDAPNVLKYAKA